MSNAASVKLEVSASDLMNVIKEVITETTNSILARQDEKRSPEFVTRKEAMEKLNVKTALTMSRWEEKGYLSPHRIGGRIFYRKDELATAFERFSRSNGMLNF